MEEETKFRFILNRKIFDNGMTCDVANLPKRQNYLLPKKLHKKSSSLNRYSTTLSMLNI